MTLVDQAGTRHEVERVEFHLLGPLEVRANGEPVHIRGVRPRIVLTMLLLDPGRMITVDRLVEAVWAGSPPRTAETQIQICVSQLRSVFSSVGGTELIATHPAGYLIRLRDDAVDVARFARLVTSGRAAAASGDTATAASRLGAALGLWRGDVAADINSRLVRSVAVRLNEERLVVWQEWLRLELELGRHEEHIGELTELVSRYPLREKLYLQLVLALYRAGRQAEALTVCRDARRLLAEEHGLDPGDELRRLEKSILDQDPDLVTPVREPGVPRPRQLPAPPSGFVGRSAIVADLRHYLVPPAAPGTVRPAVPVVSISGAAGVGKSALAIHLACRVADAFPGGQLYAHMRGADSVPAPPEQVLNQFLRALGVPPATLPDEPTELAALFRSRIAGRRVLVVLEDVASERQVRPLLPGDPGCALLATSRQGLPGLAGARQLTVDVLDPASSVALLAGIIGEPRVRAEPEAARALAEACGYLPLALLVAAAKLSIKPHWSVGQMVRRLGDERRRLDELTLDDVGIRPSLTVSYQALEPLAARLLLLLGGLGATDFAGWVAGPLLSVDVAKAADVLDRLVEMHLVEVRTGMGDRARYRLHDLTRIFARERLAEAVTAAERVNAQHRLLRCWLFLVREAHRREFGGDHLILHSDAAPWALPPDLTDELLSTPMQWLQDEHANLVSAVTLAAQLCRDDVCWDLAVSSVTLFETRGYYDAWRETHTVALEVARRSGNRRGEAVVRYSRGGLAVAELRLADARHELEQALRWFTEAGEVHGRGLALRDLAAIDRMQGRYEAAQLRSEQALVDVRAVGDRVAEAYVLRNLAQVQLERDRLGEAEARLREALAICAEVGVRRIGAQVRYRLGQVLLAKGELDQAAEAFGAVFTAVERDNDVVGRANALLGLGSVDLARGQLEGAAAALTDAHQAARDGGSRLVEGQILLALAELRSRAGERAAAVAALDQAEAIFRETGAASGRVRVADLRERLGDRAATTTVIGHR